MGQKRVVQQKQQLTGWISTQIEQAITAIIISLQCCVAVVHGVRPTTHETYPATDSVPNTDSRCEASSRP